MNLYKLWFSRQGWKGLWLALRRADRDEHARRNLLALLGSCMSLSVYLILLATLVVGVVEDIGWGGTIAIAACAALALCMASVIIVRQKLADRACERDHPAVPADLKISVFRETCLLATLLERLASEIGMEKELPPKIEVVTRRVLLDRLTNLNLREDLNPWLLDVLLLPDGHWPTSLKHRAINTW